MGRIILALNLIVEFIDFHDVINEIEITNYLLITGFGDSEIRHVLTITGISDNINQNNFRVFTKKERRVFSKEALSYLEKLFIAGIIDFVEGEEVIEQAMLEENYNISVDIVKEHTLSILLNKQSRLQKSSNINKDLSH